MSTNIANSVWSVLAMETTHSVCRQSIASFPTRRCYVMQNRQSALVVSMRALKSAPLRLILKAISFSRAPGCAMCDISTAMSSGRNSLWSVTWSHFHSVKAQQSHSLPVIMLWRRSQVVGGVNTERQEHEEEHGECTQTFSGHGTAVKLAVLSADGSLVLTFSLG